MPDAGVFNDDVWLAYDKNKGWWAYNEKPEKDYDCFFGAEVEMELYDELFNMPELSGDQWKYSCISVIELAEWQMENAK